MGVVALLYHIQALSEVVLPPTFAHWLHNVVGDNKAALAVVSVVTCAMESWLIAGFLYV